MATDHDLAFHPATMRPLLLSKRGLPAWVSLIIGLLLTLMICRSLIEQREQSAQEQFELHTQQLIDAIHKRLHNHELILQGAAGLIDIHGLVSRQQWRTYVDRLSLPERYPGIQGVGLSKIFPAHKLAEHIATLRAEGFSDYSVRPAGQRDLYTAIIYLEPFHNRNLAAFGYDMFSEPVRREAMQRAVDQHATSISGKVRLVQETHGQEQAGFLMYVPVYAPDQPLSTPEQRWEALLGYVYSPYRMDDLMAGIFDRKTMLVDFRLYDGTEKQHSQIMYDSADLSSSDFESPHYQATREIQDFGRTWSLIVYNRKDFQHQFRSALDWTLPTLGIGISISLFALVAFVLNRRESAQALADDMVARHQDAEQRTHQLFLNMRQGVTIHDHEGRLLEANPAAQRILGLSRQQLDAIYSDQGGIQAIQSDGSEFPLERQPLKLACTADTAIQNVTLGFRHPHSDAWHWIVIDAYSYHNNVENSVELYQVFSDITEERQAEHAAQATRKLLSAVLDAASEVSIIATDPEGTITLFNRGAERLLGYDADELIGKSSPAILHDPVEVSARAAELSNRLGYPVSGFRTFVEIPEKNGSEKREWKYVNKKGYDIPVLLVVTTMRDDASGAITGYLGIAEDITERKRAERLKSEFVATVSHELRTPLTAISGALGLINGGALGALPEKAQEFIQIATKNSARLAHLINDLLDIEKITAGQMHYELVQQPLTPLLEHSIETHRTYSTKQQVQLRLHSSASRVLVTVDGQRLMQVLANLLSNAIKFSPVGGTVSVDAALNDTQVRVSVRDQGSGVPRDFQDRLFERFAQADSTDTRQQGGTGLGLAISHELIQAMGGTIGYEDTVEDGAYFWFELPITG